MLSRCAREEQHRQVVDQVKGHIHCRIAGAAVAVAEAVGSCRSAEERGPSRGIEGWMGGRRIATAEVGAAVVCCGSWLSKTVSEGGSATTWPLPGRVRRV
jgi:hypothetical protein